MRVGIISMQRVCNKGSFLQAYGLKKLIESLGHEVEFVDYKVQRPILKSYSARQSYYKLRIRNFVIKFFEQFSLLRSLLPAEYRQIIDEHVEYKKLLFSCLGITNELKYRTPVDVLVVGSDEVFNCTQINPAVGYSLEIFGKDNKAKKLISYAASFGNTTYDKITNFRIEGELRKHFDKFNEISVRDQNSCFIIQHLISIIPQINLDPVLMYDFMANIKDEQIRQNYIIVYAYRDRITKEEEAAIKSFAKKTGKTLISVSGQMDFCDEHLTLDPFQCLNLFRHADYVITDTFHGTIFSIINRIKFVTLIRNSKGESYGNQEKLQDLLNRLNLNKRSFSIDVDNLEERLSDDINYTAVFAILKDERRKTMDYLQNAIS